MKQLSGSAWEKIIGPTPWIGPFCQIPFDSIASSDIISSLAYCYCPCDWSACVLLIYLSILTIHFSSVSFDFMTFAFRFPHFQKERSCVHASEVHVLDTIFKMSISISRYLLYFFTSIKCVREGRGATCEHFLPTYANMSSGQNRGLRVVGNIWIFDQGHEKGTVGDIGGEEGKIWLNLSHHLLLQGSTELLVLALDTKHPEPFLVGSLTTDMNFQNYRVTPCCSIPV